MAELTVLRLDEEFLYRKRAASEKNLAIDHVLIPGTRQRARLRSASSLEFNDSSGTLIGKKNKIKNVNSHFTRERKRDGD